MRKLQQYRNHNYKALALEGTHGGGDIGTVPVSVEQLLDPNNNVTQMAMSRIASKRVPR